VSTCPAHAFALRARRCRPGQIAIVGDALLGAVALMLIFEGLMPFLSPRGWRSMFERALAMKDGQIRFIGLASIVIGLVLLAVWR
jgi:hypothetical protein